MRTSLKFRTEIPPDTAGGTRNTRMVFIEVSPWRVRKSGEIYHETIVGGREHLVMSIYLITPQAEPLSMEPGRRRTRVM